MTTVCGVYGFEITRPFEVAGVRVLPRITDYRQAQSLARDQTAYHLTAVLVAEHFEGEFLYRLEAVLSFIEHLDVAVTEPASFGGEDYFAALPPILRTVRRSSGGGAVIGSDTFFHDSRKNFVAKALARLDDDAHCAATGYRTLFFKCTEPFRQRRPFIEVTYFLLFSGIETYARRLTSDQSTREVAIPLARALKQLGFNVFIDRPADAKRSMSTYARLRNALFHDSSFVAYRKVAGNQVTYRLEDYLVPFELLARLVVLKATDFDDSHINWDSWIDRQPFK